MRIKMLAVQHKQDYPGELAPNIMEVTDEFIDEDNPNYFPNAVAKALAEIGHDLESHTILEIDIPTDQIIEALNPTNRVDAVLRSPNTSESGED